MHEYEIFIEEINPCGGEQYSKKTLIEAEAASPEAYVKENGRFPILETTSNVKYEIGDFVSKPVTGICKIENILYLNPQDEKNDKLYYLMKPVEDEKEKIYVPVSNSASRLRLCLTKEEAWNLIKRIPEIPTAWTNNEKMREQSYKEAVKSNDPKALVAIIKMIYQRKQKRLAQGKKCTTTDTRYFQVAENLLYVELGIALGKPKQQICKTIIDYMNQSESKS